MGSVLQEASKKRKPRRFAVLACVISVLAAISGLWAFCYFFTDVEPAKSMHDVVHVKELFKENVRLRKCLADVQQLCQSVTPCKVAGRETLCFDDPSDRQLYADFKETCVK